MYKPPKEASASQLRRREPELALRLETEHLVAQAEAMRLNFCVRRSPKNVSIEVAMSDGMAMRISPIRKGAKGYYEWGIYLKNPFQPNQMEFLIHAHVEIFSNVEDQSSEVESFTTMGKRLEVIINQGIQIFHVLTGAKISLVTRGDS